MKTKKLTIHVKSLLVGLFSIISVSAFSQKTDTITVSSIDELFEAIASNKVILMAEGNYDISKLDDDKKTNSVKMQLLEDGINRQFVITGVSNLKIIGIGKKPSKIYTPNPNVTVITFRNCKNVVVDNIDAGHKAEKGSCEANVIDILEGENITIKNSILYGSGYRGILANGVKKLKLIRTTITDCSYRIFELNNCMNATMDSCIFTKTAGGVILNNVLGLTISNSEFSENVNPTISGDLAYYTYLIEITASTNIKFTNLNIESNNTTYFVKSAQSVTIDSDTDFKENKFTGTFEN